MADLDEAEVESGRPLLGGRSGTPVNPGIKLRSDFGEYDDNWQLLRIECVSETDTRRLLGVLEAVISTSILSVVIMVTVGVSHWSTTAMQTANAVVASVTVGCSAACVVWMVDSVTAARASAKRWSARRLRMLVLYCVQLAAMTAGMLAYLGINMYGLLGLCDTLTPVVIFWLSTLRWSCWNVQFLLFLIHADNCTILLGHEQRDAMVLDLPLTHHWPKLVLAAAFQAMAVMEAIWLSARHRSGLLSSNCKMSHCAPDAVFLTLTIGLVLLACVYYALFIATTLRASRLLRRRPWTEYRLANTIFRLQIRLALYSYTLVFATMLLFWFVDLGSCSEYSFQWFGLPPAQVVWCVVTIICCLMFAPKDPGAHAPVIIAQLQEFAWTEAALPQKLQERNSRADGVLDREPMFCFETATKLFLWCCLVYDYLEEDPNMQTPFRLSDSRQLRGGMDLLGLRCSKLLYDSRTSIKALFAWSDSTIVIAFRGSATMANLMADAQFWQTVHLVSRRPALVAARRSARPMVHSGFSSCWYANNMNTRVLSMVNMLLRNALHSDVKLMLTGHSLGGALAQLASFDITRTFGLRPDQVTCITFGAPRTGNAAFAAEVEREVPATWHVINDQDVVPRGAKFVNLYKRAGHKVIITGRGDLVVRPAPIESSMLQAPFGSSLSQHALSAYQAALMAVCISQLDDTRRLPGGYQGLLDLVRSCPVIVQDMHRYVTGDWRSQLLRVSARVWRRMNNRMRPEKRVLVATSAALGGNLRGARLPARSVTSDMHRAVSAPYESLIDDMALLTPSPRTPSSSSSAMGPSGVRQGPGTRPQRPRRPRAAAQAFTKVELVPRNSLAEDADLLDGMVRPGVGEIEMREVDVELGGARAGAAGAAGAINVALSAFAEPTLQAPPPVMRPPSPLSHPELSLDGASSLDSVQSAPP